MNSILGIDPSLTSSGYCYSYKDRLIVGTIKTKKLRGPERLEYIVHRISKILEKNITHICYEGYSMGSNRGRPFTIGELGGVLSLLFYTKGIEVYIVAPTSLKKFSTGKGVCEKADMINAVKSRWDHQCKNSDEADAFCLYKLGECLVNPRKFRLYPRKIKQDIIGKYNIVSGK